MMPSNVDRTDDRNPIQVLLVDDHDDTLTLLGMALERHGYRVLAAQSLAEAIERAQGEHVDVLVSDLGLPDGSGYQLLERIGPLPAIALSGYGGSEDVRRSQEAGFREHLVKPVGVQALVDAIGRAVRG